MSYTEENIMYEGENFFVIKNKKGEFELCKNGVTSAFLVGQGNNLEQIINCAKRLERFADKITLGSV